jgi:23S rRNA (cytosine1962-C5)-methyltransferase
MPSTAVFLKPGKEKKFRNFHVLAYREELLRVKGRPEPGDVVDVRASDGTFLGRGTFTDYAHIPLRLLTRQSEPIDAAFFERRLSALLERKRALVTDSDAFRWVHGEADGLPGLVVDVYANVVVVQVRTLGMERLRPLWEPLLLSLPGAQGLHERSDMERRQEERLPRLNRTLAGEVPQEVTITEGPARFLVDVRGGLKTGFFLDQREHRAWVRQQCRPGLRVLDLFCYSGGFAINAALGGAQGLAVDLHSGAIELARRNAALNGVSGFEFQEANAFDHLEAAVSRGERWDLLVIDPPAIAHSAEKGDRLKWATWKLLNRGLQLLEPGGKVMTFICSQHLTRDLFLETSRMAAGDAGRRIQILREAMQPPDHPWVAQLPESLYLRGFFAEVTDVRTHAPRKEPDT